jgi:shikimate kinase
MASRRHVILVGLSGSGKTTVGRLAAAALGAPFVDLDEAVERRAGTTVAAVFHDAGEAAFRALETWCGEEALASAPSVIATGGGFVEDAANRDAAGERGLVVYLAVSPHLAATRLQGVSDRPLLEGGSRGERLAELLRRREAAYLTAEQVVTTDDVSAAEVAAMVVSLARGHAGW